MAGCCTTVALYILVLLAAIFLFSFYTLSFSSDLSLDIPEIICSKKKGEKTVSLSGQNKRERGRERRERKGEERGEYPTKPEGVGQ